MAYFRDEEIKVIRDCQLEWHCHEVVLTQPNMPDGHILSGYGVIKSQEDGQLALEFICLESSKPLRPDSSIPEDLIDEKQTVLMSAKAVDGSEIVSKNLYLETSISQAMVDFPKLYRLALTEVEICDEPKRKKSDTDYLYLEFNEICSVPVNKKNTTESSLGIKSSAWNQADIELDKARIKIIKHDEHMSVSISGKGFDREKMKRAIIFYLGFSSGVFVQPYFERWRCSSACISVLRSIDRKIIHRSIDPPIRGLRKVGSDAPLDSHYELFKNIYKVSIENTSHFESIYSQWERIWHSFFSSDIGVPMLVVSIAVEGILNDIFIPEITDELRDEEFENEKKRVKEKIHSLEGVSESHLKTIEGLIDRWGGVYPKSALKYLLEKQVIDNKQLECWDKLRNSSAHPKLLIQDERRVRKNRDRTIMCLGLFYRLVLNVYAYKGEQYSSDTGPAVYDYIQVLNK